MGKARGPRRKQAPARSNRLLSTNNSGLVSKSGRRQKNVKGEGHSTEGSNGGTTRGKRARSEQFLIPNKRSRGGKRRRKRDGPEIQPRRSSEAAAIQAEYAAVDARAKAKEMSEDTACSRGGLRVRLAPASADLPMPSQGSASTQGAKVPSSVEMVDALLKSISDDTVPRALPARPVRAAPRRRKGNPYAALQESDEEDVDVRSKQGSDKIGVRGGIFHASGNGSGQVLSFVPPSGFSGASLSLSGGGGVARGAPAGGRAPLMLNDDEDPGL